MGAFRLLKELFLQVQQGFLGLSGCYLLFGSKWNVFEDYLDLSHLSVNCMGTMLSLSGGRRHRGLLDILSVDM